LHGEKIRKYALFDWHECCKGLLFQAIIAGRLIGGNKFQGSSDKQSR
jgi:hypothetical protein